MSRRDDLDYWLQPLPRKTAVRYARLMAPTRPDTMPSRGRRGRPVRYAGEFRMGPKPVTMRQVHPDFKWSHTERPAGAAAEDGVPAAERRWVHPTPLGNTLSFIATSGNDPSAHIANTLLRKGSDPTGWMALSDSLQEENHEFKDAFPWDQMHQQLMVDRAVRPLVRRAVHTHGYDPAMADVEMANEWSYYVPALAATASALGIDHGLTDDHLRQVVAHRMRQPEFPGEVHDHYHKALGRIAGYYQNG